MKTSNQGKIPNKFYLIVQKCENLPDLRTEKEKKRGKQPLWRVTFPDVKESLSTDLKEGLSSVTWMCECFLTLKPSSDSFSMIVMDDNSRKAGSATIKFENIPVGDASLLKPGKANEGGREVYCNLNPINTLNLNSTNSLIKFWIWSLEFSEIVKPISNLTKLKAFSKSATNLFKDSDPKTTLVKSNKLNEAPLNPFESDYNDHKTTNPFDENPEECAKKFGKSSFFIMENHKIANISKGKEFKTSNPFMNRNRSSSLSEIENFSNKLNYRDYTENIQTIEQKKIERKTSTDVSTSDLRNFQTLCEVFKSKQITDDKSIRMVDEEFFSLLNETQRQYATNLIKMKSLEKFNKQLTEELNDLKQQFYLLKNKVISNNLSHILQEIYL